MPEFSPRLLRGFVQTVSAELGTDGLPSVLDKAGLPSHLADPAAVARFDASAAAQAYADTQRALRLYLDAARAASCFAWGLNSGSASSTTLRFP